MGIVVTRALALLAVAILIGAAHLWAQPVKTSLDDPAPIEIPESTDTPNGIDGDPQPQANQGSKTDTPNPAQSTFDPNSLGQEITIQEAFKLFKLGTVFIDARDLTDYIESHIPMAFALSPEAIGTDQLDTFMTYVAPEQRIVIYCEGGDCHASESVGIYLQDLGYATVHILAAGFPAWQDAGYELEEGNPYAEDLP